ncbi:hypothetical protein INR79_08045 [Vibrio sp. SCSIO 43132]|uniref:hypothetical protein n=1 Tax=Vibrio sp. SCSIO 43132 TaxID=2779363 RepID=UPI001CA9379B|nr:hypothetical protein [Vibrio sp. SCSIO 43132]UAB71833.1 hypothetical protein INR79_08045 [Vibrio sp. SCSIO 43132]
MKLRIAAALSMLVGLPAFAELAGQVNLEHRQFFHEGLDGQGKEQTSLVLKPQWYWTTESGDGEWSFTPFARFDSMDSERTHYDIRELQYLHVFEDFEVRAGIGKVFWGVTESAHLVDVVNQSDAVESLDGEQKLGQPMVQFTFERDWGIVDALVLPYFRERTFAGEDGRLRLPVSDDALYESSKEEKHVDFAFRYSQMFGDWDVGLSYFNGTNRDPYFRKVNGEFKPYYAQMSQVGLDVQGIVGDWLWKLESIYRDSDDNHTGVVAGFEYTFVGIAESDWDVGVIAEYLYDSRGNNAQNIGQNDVFFGTRLVANDAEGTEFLIGMTQDLDNSDVYNGRVEASSRINNQWKWRVDAWLLQNDTPTDLLYFGRQDDFVELSLEYYF